MPWWHEFYGLALALPIPTLIALAAHTYREGTGLGRLFALWALAAALIASASFAALFFDSPDVLRRLSLIRVGTGALMPVLTLALAATYTGSRVWLRPGVLMLFSVVPAFTVGLVVTGHSDWLLGPFDPTLYPRETAFTPGRWLQFHLTYTFSLFFVALILLFLQISRTFSIYRQRAIIVFAGALISFLPGLLFFIPAMPQLNWSVVGLSLTSVFWYWGLFRYQLLAKPLARNAILESMEDAVWIEADGRLIDLNPAAERLFGLPRRQAIGAPADVIAERALLPPLTASLDAVRTEIRLSPSGGDVRHFDVHISPIRAEGEPPVGRLVVLRDITERVQLVEDLETFAGAVAHDIKSPLSAVVGSLTILHESRGLSLDGELFDLAEAGAASAKRMGGIVDGLLLLASVRRKRDVPSEKIDMRALIEGVLETRLRPLARERRARIELAAELPETCGYAPWLEEVWANYISNALKYGGNPPLVMIGGEQKGSPLRFWVRDNGPGLSQDERAQLFEEFTRLAPERAGGHGLGLSITRRIVERQGGRVGVDSTPGSGCTFWFTLPGGDPE